MRFSRIHLKNRRNFLAAEASLAWCAFLKRKGAGNAAFRPVGWPDGELERIAAGPERRIERLVSREVAP